MELLNERGMPMPLYDFECTDCGQKAEHLAHIGAETSDEPCGACGSTMKRLPVVKMHLSGVGRPADEGADGFTQNADSFIGAMDDFGDTVGSRLTKTEKDRAVARLESARQQ
jgi:putative FmdB family regulatory protein